MAQCIWNASKKEAVKVDVMMQEPIQEVIHDMTVEQLKAYAVERSIDLIGATKKPEIIAIIEQNQ